MNVDIPTTCQPLQHDVPTTDQTTTSDVPLSPSIEGGQDLPHPSVGSTPPSPIQEEVVGRTVTPTEGDSVALSRPRCTTRPPPRYEPESGTWS